MMSELTMKQLEQDTKIVCPVCDTEYKLSEIEEPTECEQCGHYWIAIPNLEDKGE